MIRKKIIDPKHDISIFKDNVHICYYLTEQYDNKVHYIESSLNNVKDTICYEYFKIYGIDSVEVFI